MKKILALVLTMVCILSLLPTAGLSAFAATDITARFTDANFKSEVYRLIGKASGSVINDSDVAGIKELGLWGKDIANLNGIEYFTALETLHCSKNRLTALNVSSNTKLKELYCLGNQLTTLDLSNNTALTYLDCSENKITSLDLSKNTELKTLHCYLNDLTALDVTNNVKLTLLSCYQNKLTALDVTKNTELTKLYCYSNSLTALDVSKNIKLTELWCSFTNLTAIDVSKNTGLIGFGCAGINLTALDVSKNTKLTHLNCTNNRLTTLDVSKNTALTELHCRDNQLTELDVSKNTKLDTLICQGNQMESLAKIKGLSRSKTTVNFTPQYSYDNRYFGDDRITTAIEASKAGWVTANNVVLTNDLSFADALAGGPLAKMLNAPILLIRSYTTTAIESSVVARIKELKADNIYILGGTSAVHQGVENQLISAGYNVERIFGADRYETANAIARKMDSIRGKTADFTFVASGVNFPDALAAAPVAANRGVPILFANKDGNLWPSSEEYVKEKGIKNAVLLGGEGIVKNLNSALNINSKRISGADRYETSAKIYTEYKNLFDGKAVVIATGRTFPDALSGSALAAKTGAPILLVNGTGGGSQPVKTALDTLSPARVYILGGPAAINDANINWYGLISNN